MNNSPSGEAIRLTNLTAKALREQAKRQQLALRVTATVLTVLLAALSVVLGIRNLIAVPLTVAFILLMDGLLLTFARGRYVQLTGQAICTEAAARQIRGERKEQARREQARRDLAGLKADLGLTPPPAEEDAEDDDLYGAAPARARGAQRSREDAPQPVDTAQHTRVVPAACAPEDEAAPAPHRRRRQARLQVISSPQVR